MSANSAGICWSFKTELMLAYHALGAGPRAADVFKAALYLQNQSIGPSTTAYSGTGEVSGSGYTAGGATVTNGVAPTGSGGTSYWTPSASIQWSSVTLASAFDCWLLYNASQGNRAVLAATFSAQTVNAGNFIITQPTNAAGSALINLS